MTASNKSRDSLIKVPAPLRQGVYADLRSERQRASDAKIVSRQIALLTPGAATNARISTIIEQLQAVQDDESVLNRVPFDRHFTGSGDDPDSYVLVSRGELVVRVDPPAGVSAGKRSLAEQRRAVVDHLAELGYEPHPYDGDQDDTPRDVRSVVFRAVKGTAKDTRQLSADIGTLRGRKIAASMNLIVPLGHIVKGDDYPGTTTGPGPAGSVGSSQPRVRVALIDTGITEEMRNDKWLAEVIRGPGNRDQVDIAPSDGRLDWFAGHGTFAAGVVQQMSPSCQIVAYRFTTGAGIGTEKDLAEAMLRAAQEAQNDNVHLVINASVGTPGVDGDPPLALRDAVELIEALYPDVVIVASAGNNHTDEPMYPAAFPQVVGVGALTSDLQPAPFSSFGSWVTCSTVGVGVVSTFVKGIMPPDPLPDMPDYEFGDSSWAVWSGTSFSAPQISGALARLCEDNPGLTPRTALTALLSGQPDLPGFGRVIGGLLPGTPA